MVESADMTYGTGVHGSATPGSRRPLRLVWLILGLALLLDIGLGWRLYQSQASPPPSDPPGVRTFAPPEPAPYFQLADQNGQPFTQESLKGHWTLMLFGYTNCPDFCPTTLAALNNLYHRLKISAPKLAADTQVVFVSVDPFRDTRPVLGAFVAQFNPRFVAATGAPEQLRRLTTPLGAAYDYADLVSGEPLNDGSRRPLQAYAVDHAAGLYIFDPHANNVAWILPPHTPERLATAYQFIRRNYD